MTSIDPAHVHVEFDTHGMTDECPLPSTKHGGWTQFSQCMKCPHFTGSNGFTVFCGYPGYLANKEKEVEHGNTGRNGLSRP